MGFMATVFDGIAGGILGGLITAKAVQVTLVSEQRRYDRERKDERALHLAADARRLRPDSGVSPHPGLDLYDWLAEVEVFAGSIRRRHRRLAALLDACVETVGNDAQVKTSTEEGAPSGGMMTPTRLMNSLITTAYLLILYAAHDDAELAAWMRAINFEETVASILRTSRLGPASDIRPGALVITHDEPHRLRRWIRLSR